MTRTAYLTAAAAIALSVAPASTAVAQDAAGTNVTQRVDRIERELRAVQRRVFPGGAGVFQPEVQPGDTSTAPLAGSTPIADLTARVDALEAQLTRVTGEVEQTAFRQRELEAGIARLRTELSGRIDRLETAAAASAPPVEVAEPLTVRPTPSPTPAATPAPRPTTPSPTPAATPAPRPTTPRPTPAPTPTPTPRPTTGAATTAPATPAAIAARRARVAALEMPATGNAAEDAYLFGYRLWDAGLYPEAQAQLKKVVDTYPTHRRASFAANLLGRAYLDNGQPSLAVGVFYDNYRTRPRGERAPDSVYYMGQALTRLNRRSDACQTFDEFTRVYGATASETLKAQVATARSGAGC